MDRDIIREQLDRTFAKRGTETGRFTSDAPNRANGPQGKHEGAAPVTTVRLFLPLDAPLPTTLPEALALRSFDITPRTIEEADQLIGLLAVEVTQINEQLSDPARRDLFEDVIAFADWRRRALTAKKIKENEIAVLKLWRNARRSRQCAYTAAITDPDNPLELLRAAAGLFSEIIKDDPDVLTPEETLIANAVITFQQRS